MPYTQTQSETSRRHVLQFLAVLIAAVAYQRASGVVHEKSYEDLLYAMIRGEIVIRGATGIALVQGPAKGLWSSGSSWTVTLTNTPANGNIIILDIGLGGGMAVSSVTQTGVTWTGSGTGKQINNILSSFYDSEIWLGVVGSGVGKIITITAAAGTVYAGVGVACEYSGVATTSFLDKTAVNSGIGATSTTGTTATTTQPNELLIGAIYAEYGSAAVTQSTPTNSFTLRDGVDQQGASDHYSMGYLERIVSSTGAYGSGTTNATSDARWSGCIATFVSAAITVTASDAGSGLEALTSSVTFGISDSGSGADNPKEEMDYLDNAIGGENPIIPWLQIADSGTGAEGEASSVTFSVGDAGSGLDSPAEWMYYNDQSNRIHVPGAPINVSDAGAGADVLSLQITITDVGSGADVTTFTFDLADSGFGSDSPTLQATLALYDAGLGSETSSLQVTFSVGDAGSGDDEPVEWMFASDQSNRIHIPGWVFWSDYGSGAELVLLEVTFEVDDVGVGSEVPGTTISLSDVGSGSELFAYYSLFAVNDVGSGLEVPTSTATFGVSDVGVGFEIFGKRFTIADSMQGDERFAIRLLKSGRLQYTVRLTVTENAFDPAAYDPYSYE